MKSILYVGATLMIGASVYGFVDYKQTSQKKEFTNMYAEEKVPEPVVSKVVAEKPSPAPVSKPVLKKEKQVAKKEVNVKEDVLPVVKPIADEEKLTTTPVVIGSVSVTLSPAPENTVVKKTKKRKLDTKLFSRGALDERYIEPKAKRNKKTEDKEQ